MTHGGLLGVLEAVHSGIPVIGIPFFFDQPRNILKLVEQGSGILLDYETMTKDTVYNAIMTIVNNDRLEIVDISKVKQNHKRSNVRSRETLDRFVKFS